MDPVLGDDGDHVLGVDGGEVAMPLTTVDRVLSWVKKDNTFDPSRQSELERCIASASRVLARITGRQLERVTRSFSLDGNDMSGCGDVLRLPRGDRPVIHTTTPNLVTVTEDGVALTVATGYSVSAGVILRGANADSPCELIRNGCAWSPGFQNILVGYKCGWALDVTDDPQPVPEDVIQLANCMAWMMLVEPSWIGKQNVSAAGAAVSISSDLPAYEAEVLMRLTVL